MFFLLSVWFRDPALWFDVNEGEKVTERERREREWERVKGGGG